MLIEQDLKDQCEQIQQDLLCVLDGMDVSTLDNVCQIIVDRIEILRNKFKDNRTW